MLHEHIERCRLCLDEGAVRAVKSSVPGLKWEVEKDPAKGGSRVRLLHQPSSKLLWTLASDVIPDADLQSSLQALDRIWKETDVDWTQNEKDLMSNSNLGSTVAGVGRRCDSAKKPIRHADPNEPIIGKQVRFQENVNELDRLQSALRKGEVREADMENSNG
jgi:hypothetical protein